ncbi:MAG: CysS/YqeB C-terminal domain-containing protein, partial [Acidimicrobiales bacterium]
GWHTECVVMSLGLLGDGFDLHGGGIDLAFPHHENERAQALGLGREFARHWVHSEMVVAESGAKMAKSEGNAVSLPELLDLYSARALRLAVLQAHYRSQMELSPAVLQASAEGVDRIDAFAREFAAARGHAPDPELVARFVAHMDDDLDTPKAVADLFMAMRSARGATGEEAAALASGVLELWEGPLGLALPAEPGAIPPEVADLARQRDEARAAGEWNLADRLRGDLQNQGWIVEDTPGGTTVRR